MDYCYQHHDVHNTTVLPGSVDDTCHIKLDPGNEDGFDMEAVWCSSCQRPRFAEDIFTVICVCPSFTNSIDSWLQHAVENSAFENQQTGHYNAVNSWQHMPAPDNAYPSLQISQYDVMMDLSTLATSTGRYTPSMNDVPSLATSATSTNSLSPVSRASRASSTTSVAGTTSAAGGTPPCERDGPEVDHPNWSQYHRLMNAKQKRREQNRKSQQTFRDRKERITKDLQSRIEELTKLNEILSREISVLRKEVGRS